MNKLLVGSMGKSSLALILLIISSCTPEVMCTMDFRMVTVRIKNGTAVRSMVIDLKTKDTLSSEVIWSDSTQADFRVADDGEIFNRLKKGEKRDFRFVAFNINKREITGDFVISRDECHILKVSGPSELSF
jgi:hypothetical protein